MDNHSYPMVSPLASPVPYHDTNDHHEIGANYSDDDHRHHENNDHLLPPILPPTDESITSPVNDDHDESIDNTSRSPKISPPPVLWQQQQQQQLHHGEKQAPSIPTQFPQQRRSTNSNNRFSNQNTSHHPIDRHGNNNNNINKNKNVLPRPDYFDDDIQDTYDKDYDDEVRNDDEYDDEDGHGHDPQGYGSYPTNTGPTTHRPTKDATTATTKRQLPPHPTRGNNLNKVGVSQHPTTSIITNDNNNNSNNDTIPKHLVVDDQAPPVVPLEEAISVATYGAIPTNFYPSSLAAPNSPNNNMSPNQNNASTAPRASYVEPNDTLPADDVVPGWTTIPDHQDTVLNDGSGWGAATNSAMSKTNATGIVGNKSAINDNTAAAAATSTPNYNNAATNQSTLEDEIDTWSYVAAVDNNDVMNNTFTSNTKSPDRTNLVPPQQQTIPINTPNNNNNRIKTTIAMPGGSSDIKNTSASAKNGIGVGVNAGYNATTGTKASTVMSSSIHNNSNNNVKKDANNKGVSWTDDNVTTGSATGGGSSSAISVASSTYGEDRQRVQDQNVLDPYGDRGTYTGIILRSTGMPHGTGTMIYQEDHRTYVGEWRHGRWHGHGTATFANGDSYVGEYRFDQRHGRGRYEWNDGRVYDGYDLCKHI